MGKGGGKKKPMATSYFWRKAKTWGKGKKRKQEVSSEDSDDYRPKKKNKNKIKKSAFDIDQKNIVATAGRRTRGVKIDYSLIEGSEDSDEKKEDEGPKGKGKGPRKWDGTDDEF